MDPASLAFGGAGLVLQLHEAVLGCIEAIRNFRDAGEQNALLNCKLQIEQHILLRWGQRCELAGGKLQNHLPDAEDREMALMILRNMMGIVAETETLKKRYGMDYVSAGAVDTSAISQRKFSFLISAQRKQPISKLGALTAAFGRTKIAPVGPASSSLAINDDIYRQCIQKGQTTMSFMRKYRWIVVDNKRFEEMIGHLQDLNKSLYRLTQHLFPASSVESDILEATPDRYLDIVERATSNSYPRTSFGTNIRLTIAQTESTESSGLAASTPQRNLRIQKEQLTFRETSPRGQSTRAIATFRSITGRLRPVLVEWRPFASGLTQHTREASIKRAENLARILQKKPSKAAAEYFRILECVGYYVTDQEVGYVFDLPQGTSSRLPISLEDLLEGAPDSMDNPALELRLNLCKSLCNSIYWLHASNLVHKGIRSNNILFFVREGEKFLRITDPYVTGFDHSRPDGPNDPTITISAISPDDDRYRHPDARLGSTSRRSTKIHDMYSLGLLLLEITHWVQLKLLVALKTGDEVKRYLSSPDCAPIGDLDHMVGSRLQGIVKRCIDCDFEVDINDPGFSTILQDIFLYEITSEVMKCSV